MEEKKTYKQKKIIHKLGEKTPHWNSWLTMAALCLTRVKHTHNPASDRRWETLHRSPANWLPELNKPQRSDSNFSLCESHGAEQTSAEGCTFLRYSLTPHPPPFLLSKSGWIIGSQASSLNGTRSTKGAVLLISFLSLTGETAKKNIIITHAWKFRTGSAPWCGNQRRQAHKRCCVRTISWSGSRCRTRAGLIGVGTGLSFLHRYLQGNKRVKPLLLHFISSSCAVQPVWFFLGFFQGGLWQPGFKKRKENMQKIVTCWLTFCINNNWGFDV